MAIRNDTLGTGTNWNTGDDLVSADVNDTIDELVRVIELGY